MDRLGYTAMSAASRTMKALGVRGNNLANASTPGFRADLEKAVSLQVQGPGYASRHLTQAQGNGVSLAAGALMATGRELDFAIKGPGFLAVQGDEGNEAYTRHGSLQLDADSRLTLNGRAVLGEGGPIEIPPFGSLHIGTDGVISIRPAGELAITEVGRLKLVNLTVFQVRKDAAGLLVSADGQPAPMDDSVVLAGGYLEASNVSAIDQLVATMSLSRLFETQVKMMKTAEDLSDAGNRMMRS